MNRVQAKIRAATREQAIANAVEYLRGYAAEDELVLVDDDEQEWAEQGWRIVGTTAVYDEVSSGLRDRADRLAVTVEFAFCDGSVAQTMRTKL